MANKEKLGIISLLAVDPLLIAINVLSFSSSGLLSRVIMLLTFVFLLFTIVWFGTFKNSASGRGLVFAVLTFSSLFFLIWRSSLLMPGFTERGLHSETITLSRQYAENGHLVLDSAHSYFFLEPLVLHFLFIVGGLSVETGIYISLVLYGTMVVLLAILFVDALQRNLKGSDRRKDILRTTIPPLVAFSFISYAYSERSGRATDFSMLITLIAMYFLFSDELKNARQNVVFTLLVLGTTIGSRDGILFLIPFFFALSCFKRKRLTIVYALIPVAYLSLSAYSYVISLKTYTRLALTGFIEFFQKLISGGANETVMPWQRPSGRTLADIYVSSAAYLAVFAVSTILAIALVFLLISERKKPIKNNKGAFERTCLVWLSFWLVVAVVTYIGASASPQTSSSDIRTITITILSLVVPFVFVSTRLANYISSRKILLSCLIFIMIISSIRTVYDVTPKSINDPIYVVEDDRLGLTSVYAVADFINAYYRTGGIVSDYKVSRALTNILASTNKYETRFIDETTLTEPFELFQYNSILVFTLAGITYPSVYHSREAYMAAYNFSMNHNQLYDNGVVVIACQEKVAP